MNESRIQELQAEKVRLGNLDAMGILDSQKFKERMLQIDLMIEELERETDPFDKMFPGMITFPSLSKSKGSEELAKPKPGMANRQNLLKELLMETGGTMSDMDRQIMKNGGEASFPDLSGDGKVTQKDILIGRGVIEKANGGEIDMALADVSRGTMDMEAPQMQPSQEEMAAVQQIMDMVMQMMQSGASEEEIIAALKEMGLSDQDIAMVMQAIVEQGQQQNPIDAELSQMM